MIFSYFKHYFIFLVMDIWYFHLSNGKGRVSCGLSPFLLYTQDCLSKHSYSHTSLISSLLKNSALLLAFCSLFLRMVEQIQTYPSSISPLGLFHGIICGAFIYIYIYMNYIYELYIYELYELIL